MTVRDFALAAHEPKELVICMRGTEYSLISNYTEKLDRIMLEVFGDYVVEDFCANEPQKYCLWIREVPVKEVRA